MINPHKKASEIIVSLLINAIKTKQTIFTISLAGESGCGKTVTGQALVTEFGEKGISAIVIGQDNYFFLPPSANDTMRKKDPSWLGPHKEVDLKRLDHNLFNAMNGAQELLTPHIDYETGIETIVPVPINDIKVIIVEGTYTSLLRHIDVRIFIDADYHDTLPYRIQRNRGNEVNDPFVEGILETEHKIIAGHKNLADIIITKTYDVVQITN
jgi:uridine kinase